MVVQRERPKNSFGLFTHGTENRRTPPRTECTTCPDQPQDEKCAERSAPHFECEADADQLDGLFELTDIAVVNAEPFVLNPLFH
jgi:hypothetical protein